MRIFLLFVKNRFFNHNQYKFFLIASLSCCNLSLFSNEFPEIIDFGKYNSIDSGYYSAYEQEAFDFGLYAFNYAPDIAPFFAILKNKYHISTVVETGTYYGGTALVFGLIFEKVYTVEISEHNYLKARNNLSSLPNISCLLGRSTLVLQELLPSLKDQRLLFYLDAHWDHENFPLNEELRLIGKTHKNNCIIVIDDFKVEGRTDIDYDIYPTGSCALHYIKDDLDSIFTDYSIHFLIPKSVKCRAKLIAIPKNWAS
jgi:hypothetical protein